MPRPPLARHIAHRAKTWEPAGTQKCASGNAGRPDDAHFAPRARPGLLPALLLLGVTGVASGCASGGEAYPSLARRPAERLADATPAAAAVSPGPVAASTTPSPELADRLAAIVTQARGGKRAFDDLQQTAQRTIAAAGSAPAGSEDWARATQALSAIQAARARTAEPLSDLDRLDVDDQLQAAQSSAHGNAARPNTAAIAQAREVVTELVAQEDGVLAKLDDRLEH